MKLKKWVIFAVVVAVAILVIIAIVYFQSQQPVQLNLHDIPPLPNRNP